ncbi:MAG: hypothetical protein IT579_19245, partial [Verrucomicrobia subdivision 3 bacterium]|nr:hypothetical protein [Limisphaerales bacterium]
MRWTLNALRRFRHYGLGVAMISARGLLASPGYQIDVWRADEGLPQGTVTSIAQTPDGYLWLGTQNGLVRFDGVRFQVFNEKNTPAINNNRIVQLFVDQQGTLWAGAERGSMVGVQNGAFVAYEMPGFGTTFNYARVFCDDAEGRLWVVSCEWQLMRLARGVRSVLSTNWGLSGPTSVAGDRSGQVYIGTERELATTQNGRFQIAWSQADEKDFRVEFLAPSSAGGCWVSGNGRLRRFDAGQRAADLGVYAWTNSPIYGLHEDHQHRLWVATLGSGLFRYNPDGTVLHLTTKDGLPTDFVRCVKEDREGNIWAGTEGGLMPVEAGDFRNAGHSSRVVLGPGAIGLRSCGWQLLDWHERKRAGPLDAGSGGTLWSASGFAERPCLVGGSGF